MKKKIFARSIVITGIAVLFLFYNTAWAYWVWTPGTKKFINPKNAVKDSPKEQFEWAMTFYNTKDYQRAATEFDKLTKQYEYSEYASKAQYYVGLCYENMNKFYIAFQNYQKAIDNFPHIENMDEIVAREFNIANMFAVKESPKVLGTDILTSLDRSIEIYKKVVDNAPYGRLAEEAQYRMGLAMKKAERYDEAIQAFQKILDDYPTSTFVDKAKFEVADCAYKASLKPAYDVAPTEKAIKAFEDFSHENRDRSLSKEADKTIQRLKDKAAEKSLLTAQFYEREGRYQAAIIYYKDVIDTYPESSFVKLSRSKIESLTARLEKSKIKSAPFSFMKQAKPKETVTKAAVPEQKVSKAKSWNPLGFMKPAKPKEEAAVSQAPKKTSGWNIFGVKKQSEPKEVASATEIPKAKSWMPLSFNKTAKTGNEMVVTEAKKEDKALAPVAVPEEKAPAPASETVPEVKTPAAPETVPEAKTPEPEAKSVEAEKPIVNDTNTMTKTEELPPKEEAVTAAICPAPADLRSPEPVGAPKIGDNPDDQIEKDEY